MRFAIIPNALLILLLTGCETYYKQPDSSPVAKLRFSGTASRQSIMVIQYKSAACDFGPSDGIVGVVGGINMDPMGNVPRHVSEAGNTQGMMGYSEASGIRPIERIVAADRELVFSMRRLLMLKSQPGDLPGTTRWRRCSITVLLTPKSGEEYELLYSEDQASCRATAVRLQRANDGTVQRVPEPGFRQSSQNCAD